jgi:hypothetical protein
VPPDHNELVKYIESNYLSNVHETFGYTSMICPLASRHPVSDWRNALDVFSDSDQGYDLQEEYQLYYPADVRELFPSLFQLVDQLPYKQIIGLALNIHTTDLPPHRDEVDSTDVFGPERYNVLLSPHYGDDSFFISKDKITKDYPVILKEYPVYAFNNKDIYHGATPVLDKRVIMICGGVIDNDKHQSLINRSIDKFKEYVIQY